MNEEMKNFISQHSTKIKARMGCELNRWNFPKQLEKFRPDGWDDMTRDKRYHVVIPIIHYIEEEIGLKEFLREWNRDNMNPQEFEKWWVNREDEK